MNLFSLLNAVIQIAPEITKQVDTSFITEYIGWLIAITGSVGVGIILFTLTLKIIVLPFDIYSKFKTRKNAIKMEEMRPELEKLQKQYANDKNLYQQKMMALQKKNGYSPLAGCLPMILSMVIFMVAIDSFRMYSANSMKQEYNNLVGVYNAAVLEVVEQNSDFVVIDGSNVSIKEDAFYNKLSTEKQLNTWIEMKAGAAEGDFTFTVYNLSVEDSKNYLPVEATSIIKEANEYHKNHYDGALSIIETGTLAYDEASLRYYLTTVDEAKLKEIGDEIVEKLGESFKETQLVPYVNNAVKKAYEDENDKYNLHSKFLWVENIWRPDVSYENPITNYSTFVSELNANSTHSCSCNCNGTKNEIEGLTETTYNLVTAGLAEQKKAPNGYFIMVALSIIMTFLSQFVMQKMNKAQVELQSADGDQAAMTQKMMMWMMPLMFGFFAFRYSTSFSIYMTLSSLISTVSSVIINVFVEKKFKKVAVTNEGRSKKNLNKIEQEKLAKEEEAKKKAEEKAQKKTSGGLFGKKKDDTDKKDFIK